jgi:hypothetical protein
MSFFFYANVPDNDVILCGKPFADKECDSLGKAAKAGFILVLCFIQFKL